MFEKNGRKQKKLNDCGLSALFYRRREERRKPKESDDQVPVWLFWFSRYLLVPLVSLWLGTMLDIMDLWRLLYSEQLRKKHKYSKMDKIVVIMTIKITMKVIIDVAKYDKILIYNIT